MAYKLRFVQSFDKRNAEDFLRLEQTFIDLEKRDTNMICGKRYVSLIGKEPTNTMIWEAEFETIEDAINNLKAIEVSNEHEKLLSKQVQFMRDAYVELYKEL